MEDNWRKKSKKEREFLINHGYKALYSTSEQPLTVTPPKPRGKRKKSVTRQYIESKHQQALVAWMRKKGLLFTKIHNEGAMNSIQGARLNREGRTRFMPDLFLCHPRKGQGGFFIEMKAPGQTPCAGQLAMMQTLREQGYEAQWYDDWEWAQKAIEAYLG